MALFAPKKTRTARAALLRPRPALTSWLDRTVKNRGLLLRLLLVAVAAGLMLLVLEAWRAPFPYRLGDRPDHGIAAKVAFQRINPARVDQARSEAVARVLRIFRNDPDKLKQLEALPQILRSSFTQVALAKKVEDLPPETRSAFGLTTPQQPAADGNPGDMNFEFQTLQAAVSDAGMGAGKRIDELLSEFQRFIEPLVETGVADPAEIKRLELPSDRPILVQPVAPEDDPQRVLPIDVLLSEMLKETGRLGKTWNQFSELSTTRTWLERWLRSQVQPTLVYQEAEWNNARAAARERVDEIVARYSEAGLVREPLPTPTPGDDDLVVLRAVSDAFKRGDLLVEPARSVDETSLEVLRAEFEAVERHVAPGQRIARVVTVLVILAVLAVVNGYYIVRYEPQLAKGVSRLTLYLAVLIAAVGLARLLSFDPWRATVIPLIAAVMVFAIAYNQMLASLTALTLCLIITLSTRVDLGQFVILVSVCAAATLPLAHVPSRSSLIKVGFGTAAVYFLVSWGTGILESQSVVEVWSDSTLLLHSLRGAGWCLVAGYLVAGSLPFIESNFGVVTDISLLELSDVSHPLLQELVRRAPGTYNHSMAVATIGETAADRIGANGLLVRVGAYYHDIGKMLKPQYFIENMTKGEASRHERLAPAMSTLIIIGHVKDGVDLARQHNLPQPIIDFIEQHHGTTLVEYFYHEAARQADRQPDHRTDAEEANFRYPGPKPQTRETGVMMLADAVESASRALSDPTPARIESLVHSLVMKKLLDGQFDECSLKLSELHEIEDSLVKSLIAVYHGRIKYPEQKTA
ncbi:MAG: HDIG domain-containing protein [Planctomycetes bacterium]|nr:HDIG domain-containing protein [Planctomycetota bacterium]